MRVQTWSSSGSKIAKDDDGFDTLLDAPIFDSSGKLVLPVEDTSGASKFEALLACNLGHCPTRGQISL